VTTRALVLGGGGLAGIAWHVGLLAGLEDAGLDVRDPDLVVGTSAGSVVGALLRSGSDLAELYDWHVDPAAAAAERSVDLDINALGIAFLKALTGATGEQDARARIGALALGASTAPEAERRAIIAGRLPVDVWPDAPLVVTAIDTATGDFVGFDRDAGVGLVDAVAASCAVPGVWPPTTIGGRRFMDGGLRSLTNADLAAGCDRVLVLAPFAGYPRNPFGPDRDDELAPVRRTGQVLVLDADDESTAAFGSNPLDPATRAPSARAGRRQAASVADVVREFWTT
jgi:NTE family protein